MKEMGEKKRVLLVLVLASIIVLMLCNIFVIASQENGNIKFGYEGQWYSKGFSSFWNWKLFVDTVINSLLKFTIIEKDNNYGVMIRTESGEEVRTPYLVNFDPMTGEISGTLNYSLPNGEGKILSGKVLVNGQVNITKFINPKDYINKTIKELVLAGISKKLIVSFSGKKSKTTVSVHPNSTSGDPKVIIDYEKFKPGDTSLIPENYETEGLGNTTIVNYTIENLTQVISSVGNNTNLTIQTTGNGTNKTSEISLNIINPKPSLEDISIFINETKRFSIENTDYYSIKWYLDEGVVKSNSKFYDFKGLKQGFHTLNVEVKKDSKTGNHFWNIEVKKIEVEEEKKGLGIWFWIIIIILMFIIIAAALYFLKIKANSNNASI